jgi:S1-C subfamily serine protease
VSVAAIVATDVDNDLALLRPKEKLEAGLSIVDDKATVMIGDTVEFIGYPGGYEGAMPMLGVGYIAAVGLSPPVRPGKPVVRGFVNGAFNQGNSGGPVIDLQTQTVVGVVHAKVAPMPAEVRGALNALKNQNSGFQYTVTVGGKQFNVTEAQVVESVLEHFKNQVQLVVGVMILPEHIRKFLIAHKIAP